MNVLIKCLTNTYLASATMPYVMIMTIMLVVLNINNGNIKDKMHTFLDFYDKCKLDIAEKHQEYTKIHIHNASLNRTATFLAKHIYRHLHQD